MNTSLGNPEEEEEEEEEEKEEEKGDEDWPGFFVFLRVGDRQTGRVKFGDRFQNT